METLQIYNRDGSPFMEAIVTDSAERSQTLQEYNQVVLSWLSAVSKPIPADCYIIYDDIKFYLLEDFYPSREDDCYRYDLTFHAIEDTFNRPIFFRYVDILDQSTGELHTWKEPQFDLNGNLKTIADIAVTCLNRAGYEYHFRLPLGNKYEETSLLNYSFDGESVAEVLATIADMNETEWWLERTTETFGDKPVMILHFDKCEYGDSTELSDEYYEEEGYWKSKGLKKVSSNGNTNTIPQKLYVYGSERNLKKKSVQEQTEGGLMNISYDKKLRLPKGRHTIYNDVLKTNLIIDGSDSSITIEGVNNKFESIQMFDEVYPKMTQTITDIQVKNPNSEHPIYYLNADKIKSLAVESADSNAINPGKLGLLLEGTTLMCTFISGVLNGMEFECAWRESTAQIGLVPNTDSEDMQIPFGNFAPKVGDQFILWNLNMPTSAITDAQQTLQDEAIKYIEKIGTTVSPTECESDDVYFRNAGIKIGVGKKYTIKSDIFKGNILSSRCFQYSYNLTKPYDVRFSLLSARVQGRLATIENQIGDLTHHTEAIGQTQRAISRRQWHDIEEMKEMIDAIETQMVVVGYEQDAFAFTCGISYDQKTKVLMVGKGYLQHQVYTDNAWKGAWLIDSVLQQDMKVLDPEGITPYYIYFKCSKTEGTAETVLSDLSIAFDQEGFYYFLGGILSSEFEGERVFNQTSGLTSIAGGTITTDVVQDAARKLIVDFSNARIIAREGAEIVGKIKYTATDGKIKDVAEIENSIADITQGMANYNRLVDTYKHTFYQTDTPTTYYLQPTVPFIPNADYVFSVEKITWQPSTQGDAQGTHYEIGVLTGNDYKTLKIMKYDEEQRAVVKMPSNVNASSQFVLIFNGDLTGAYGDNIFERFKLAEGKIYTGWSASSPEEYSALRLINGAIVDGSTEIEGGMVMTNVLMLKDMQNNIQAGMSGITKYNDIEDKVLLWGGGSYQAAQDAVNNNKVNIPVLLTKKGYGSNIGVFEIIQDGIKITTNGRELLFSTKKISDLKIALDSYVVEASEKVNAAGKIKTIAKSANYVIRAEATSFNVTIYNYQLYPKETMGQGPDANPEVYQNGRLDVYVNVYLVIGSDVYDLLKFHELQEATKGGQDFYSEWSKALSVPYYVNRVALKEGEKAYIKIDVLGYLGGHHDGTNDKLNITPAYTTRVKASIEEMNAQTIIASDGIIVTQGGNNQLVVKSDNDNELEMQFKGKIAGESTDYHRGRLVVDQNNILKLI